MALTCDTPLIEELGNQQDYPVVSGATGKIFEGSAVTLNVAGYASTLTADGLFLGHAMTGVDNSDAAAVAGDLSVTVKTGRYKAEVTLTGVAQTNVGELVYMSDDCTYTLSSSNSAVKVGIVDRYVTTNTCVVEFYAKAETMM